MELLTLACFCGSLLICLLFDFSILYALFAGFILFWIYGKKQGLSWKELALLSLSGIKTVKNILITFVLIGMLTALWRDAGTIPVIVCYASRLIRPSVFLVMTFLLNCLISTLTGTALGTAATMGVICATMASSMQISPALTGGAILAGAYWGDRCSPVSTSALLVAELTHTSIFHNIRKMLRTAVIPFLAACAIYIVLGFFSKSSGNVPDLTALFSKEFHLHWIALFPAIVILILSLLQVKVKIAMTASILTALPISIWIQETTVSQLPSLLLRGYEASHSDVASMINGGGIMSMVRVASIVCLSASYSGIFQKTRLLDGIKHKILSFSNHTTPYTAVLCTSIIAGMISCNQTLAIMLTSQLCRQLEPDDTTMAIDLENTAVIVAPLIPWCIAGAVPLATVGAPASSLLFACFLYLLPMWQLFRSLRKKSENHKSATTCF